MVTMIRAQTVLILGAGASAPYGFPTGRELLINVVEQLRNQGGFLQTMLSPLRFSVPELTRFAQELEGSMQPSVDAFIENRPEFVDMGKAAILGTLIPYENPTRLARGRNMHWYEYLFSRMAQTRKDYEQSLLSVVTLNYDRSFEHFLYMALKYSFGSSHDECLRLLNRTQIVHVYGQMGALDYMSDSGRPYGPDVDYKIVRRFVAEIKVGHEDVEGSDALRLARDLINSAKVVCFLGFGYHPRNIERLGVDRLRGDVTVLGSVYGMTEVESLGVSRMIPRFNTGARFSPSTEVLMFLRENGILG